MSIIDVKLSNYPTNGPDAGLMTIPLGSLSDQPTLIFENTGYDPENDIVLFRVTLSNLAEHAEVPEAIDKVIDVLIYVRDTAQAEINQQLEAAAPATTDDKE